MQADDSQNVKHEPSGGKQGQTFKPVSIQANNMNKGRIQNMQIPSQYRVKEQDQVKEKTNRISKLGAKSFVKSESHALNQYLSVCVCSCLYVCVYAQSFNSPLAVIANRCV